MEIRAEEITKILKEQLGGLSAGMDVSEVGTVLSVGDGIARLHGLERCMAGELLELPHGVMGIALNLEEDSVGAVLLGESFEIKEGDQVKRTRRIMSVPVGDALVGRVVNALGQPIDGKGAIPGQTYNPIEANFNDIYVVEKIGTKQGWTTPSPDEDWFTGYPQEMEAFYRTIAYGDRPESTSNLAADAISTIYSAYVSAEKNGTETPIKTF